MAYMCMENKIPEKPFDFFFPFLQVALSLEDHSSEVQVVKYLLHILSHPPLLPSPPHLQARCASSPESTLHTYARKVLEHAREDAGCAGHERWSSLSPDEALISTEIPQP